MYKKVSKITMADSKLIFAYLDSSGPVEVHESHRIGDPLEDIWGQRQRVVQDRHMCWRYSSLRHSHGDDVEVVPGPTDDAVNI